MLVITVSITVKIMVFLGSRIKRQIRIIDKR